MWKNTQIIYFRTKIFAAFCINRLTVRRNHTIRYDTIEEFNVDSKAEYTALSSTRSQKLKQNSAPLIQYRLRSVMSVREE